MYHVTQNKNINLVIDRMDNESLLIGDLEFIEEYLSKADYKSFDLYGALVSYRRFSPRFNQKLIYRFLDFTEDPMIVGQALLGLARRENYEFEDFWDRVFSIIDGCNWDYNFVAKIQAINSLNDCPDIVRVKKALIMCFSDF